MKSFSQLNIKAAAKGFEGDKIKMSKILNKQIVVHAYKIEDSKVFRDRGTGKCLHLQISLNNDKHVVFTSSSGLISEIQQVDPGDFPFMATIIQEDERFIFS